jgi:hypothetical protein
MPRSRLSLPSFLSQPRSAAAAARFSSLRLPLLAPLLASALTAMAAYGSAPPASAAASASAPPSPGDTAVAAHPVAPQRIA